MNILKHKFSFFILVVFSGTIIILNLANPPKQILTYDVFGYYLYLPGTFIYHQQEFSDPGKLEQLNEKYKFTPTFYQLVRAENKKQLDKYTMGLALMYLPFFLLAHLVALLWGFPIDGLSPPYQYILLAGGLIYAILGIYLLRKVLLKFFSDKIVAITLGLVIFGTNYIYDSAFKGLMPHSLIFTLYALLLWLSIIYYEKPGLWKAVFIGLASGLLVLCRPSEFVGLIIPVFWGVGSWNAIKDRIRHWGRNYNHFLLAVIAFLVVWLPQLIHWKLITGHFLFYSYGNPGEGFDFLSPHTWKVLFSFRKGWLVYTPVMFFSILGFYYAFKRNRAIFWTLAAYFILNLYLVSCWTTWWYAESFGQRALIQSYAVMAIPFGFFIQHIAGSAKRLVSLLVLVLSLAFVSLNIFQIWQLRNDILDPSRMTGAYYFAIFGKTKVSPEKKELLLIKRSDTAQEYFGNDTAYRKRHLAFEGYENRDRDQGDRKNHYDSTQVFDGRYSFRLDSNWFYSPEYNIEFRKLTDKDFAWIRATLKVFPTTDIKSNDAFLVMTFNHDKGYYKYRTIKLSEAYPDITPGQWSTVQMDYMTPEVRSDQDKFSFYVWYIGKVPFYIDDLMIDVYEKK